MHRILTCTSILLVSITLLAPAAAEHPTTAWPLLVDRVDAPPFRGDLDLPVGPADKQAYSWEWTGGPTGAAVQSLLTTPLGSLLAGAENGGLFRSDDGGDSWSESADGLVWPCCNYNVPSLAAGASTVYVGTWGGGVWRSDDDGWYWSATAAIPDEGYPIVRALETCRFGEMVWAGGNFGVARSDDGGVSWSLVNDGLPGSWILDLVRYGERIFAMSDGTGIYWIDPDGASWTEMNTGLPATYGTQSLTATEDDLFLATLEGGVYHLNCDADAWTQLADGLYDDNVTSVLQIDQTLYAGVMGSGAFRWDWYDASWYWRGDGLWNSDIRVMSSRGLDPYAGTYGAGVFRCDPDLETWSHTSDGITSPLSRCLAWDGTHVYAGSVGNGVHVSDNNGDTWTHAISGLGGMNVHELAADATGVYAGNWNGVWKSTNNGASWSASGLQGNGIFALDTSTPRLYAGTFGGTVWSSDDGGQNWNQEGTGLPTDTVQDVVPVGTTLYAATMNNGVWTLPDGDTTWIAMNDGLPALGLWCLTEQTGVLYVGLGGQGVYRWNDGLSQWDVTALDNAVVFCLDKVGTLLLAGSWGELRATDDGGTTWILVNDGLKSWLGVHAAVAAGDDAFCALDAGGVWRTSLVTAVEDPGDGDPGDVSLDVLRINPNPFSAGARVAFTLDRPQRVHLAVYDVAGRLVTTLVDGPLADGPQERVWDGTTDAGGHAAAGVYMVRLSAGGRELVAKTINLR
jgi:hypothetical protein